MSKRDKTALIIVGMTVALIAGGLVALSQPPTGPAQGPAAGYAGKAYMPALQVARGRVVAKDDQRQAIKVEGQVPMPPGNPSVQATTWVTLQPGTLVKRAQEVGLSEIGVGDDIWVRGTPTAIDARQVVVGQFPDASMEEASPPPPAGARSPVSPPFMRGPGAARAAGPLGMPGLPPLGTEPSASARGKLVSLQPLTIEYHIPLPPPPPFNPAGSATPSPLPQPQIVKVTIAADDHTRVTKIVDSSFDDIRMGEEVLATGQREPTAVLSAGSVIVGERLEEFLPRFEGLAPGIGPVGPRRLGGGPQ